jgi:hypothetical protein
LDKNLRKLELKIKKQENIINLYLQFLSYLKYH